LYSLTWKIILFIVNVSSFFRGRLRKILGQVKLAITWACLYSCFPERVKLMIPVKVYTHCNLERFDTCASHGIWLVNLLRRLLKGCSLKWRWTSINLCVHSSLPYSLIIYSLMSVQNDFKMSTSSIHPPFLEPPCTNKLHQR